MRPDLQERIARVGLDRQSGASEILAEAIAILRDVLHTRGDIVAAARDLCRAQPAMASIWNAAIAALAAREGPERLTRFAEQVARAPAAIARFAVDTLCHGRTARRPLRIVTLSRSRTVLHVLEALARVERVEVSCAEGRPGLEGRALAARLASLSIPVALYTDAALAHGLDGADAVLVGADAVMPIAVINKSGTRMLAAAATLAGVPVYVVASRDKYVSGPVANRLVLPAGSAAEVWLDCPPAVDVRNPYFETVALDLVSAVFSDFGVVGAASVAEVCSSQPTLPPEISATM